MKETDEERKFITIECTTENDILKEDIFLLANL
jgi:hypothetical protein